MPRATPSDAEGSPAGDSPSREPRTLGEQNQAQKDFFERDPARVATRLYRDPRFPRNLQKKFAFAAAELADARRVLELGTGPGRQLGFLLAHLGPQTHYYGLDIALDPLPEGLAAVPGPDRRRVLLANAQAEALPFADGSLDGVFMVDVLHHVRSQGEALGEICRVLRPGGKVLAVEPNPLHPANLIYLRDPIERGLFALTLKNARHWCSRAGLTGVSLGSFPIYFPAFPARLGPLYDRLEALLARIPFLAPLATSRLLTAVRPSA